MRDEVIDRIYEAAFVPELWGSLFEDLRGASASAGGSMLLFGAHGPPNFVATALTRPLMERFFAGDGWKGIVRNSVAQDLHWSGFRCDADFMTSEQRARDPVEHQLQAIGLGWQLATYVPMPTGEQVVFTFERRVGEGRHDAATVAQLDGLRPHLARASLIALRLGIERARALVEAMDALGLPAAAVRNNRTVLAINPAMEKLGAIIRPGSFGRLLLRDAGANSRLQQALDAARPNQEPLSRSIPVPANEAHQAAVIHVLPVRGAAFDVLGGARHIIVLTQGRHTSYPDPGLLSSLFDLTPAEARLAGALTRQQTLAEYGAATGVSSNTVKTHLKRVFEKTGVRRQSELIRLLAGLSV